MRAWSLGGREKVQNADDANRAWGSYVGAWGKMMESKGFVATMALGHQGNGQVGLLQHATYWRKYWDAFERAYGESPLNTKTASERYRHVLPMMRRALQSDNMTFFQGARGQRSLATLAFGLAQHHAVIQGPLLEWAREHVYPQVELAQGALWRKLPWEKVKGWSVLFDGLTEEGANNDGAMREILDTFARGVKEHATTANERVQLVGHFLTNCPVGWHLPKADGTNVVALMQEKAKTHGWEGVDVALIALCSGHGGDASDLQKEIKSVGRALVMGDNRGPRRQRLVEQRLSSCTYEMGAVVALYEINTVADLYHALNNAGVVQKRQVETFALPSGIVMG